MGISLNPFSLLSGAGLDVTSLVNQILTQKSGQLSQWGSEQSLLRVQAGLLGTINSDLSRLADAVTALSDPIGALTAQTATSSNPALLTATADSSVAPGVHSITVNNLATAGLVYSDSVAGGTNVSILPSSAATGQLTLQIGGAAGTTAAIQITAGSNDTLTTLAASINEQGAANDWGIRAALVNDVTGSRLSITSQAAGTPGALVISSNTTALTFNPPSGGTNASLTIDGIPYLSTSNTISGAIAGVTLNLSGAAPNTAVQLTVAPDTTQISASINEFVNAYNQVISDINAQFKVDSTTNNEGPLGGDSALRSLQGILLKAVTFSVPDNSGLVNLASLGINMNNDGTLTVGATPAGQSMNQVLASNPQAFRSFFQNATSTGFANAFHADLRNLTDSIDGLINVDLAQNKTQQDNLADSISKFQDQLAAQQKALTNQFALVNASLQTYPMLLRQITQTLSALDTGSKSSSGS